MIGSFSEKSISESSDLLGEPFYMDFTRCQRPSGKIYGSRFKCRPPAVEIGAKAPAKDSGRKGVRIGKTVNNMGVESLEKLLKDPRVKPHQAKKIQDLIDKKRGDGDKITPKVKSSEGAKVEKLYKKAEEPIKPQIGAKASSKVTDEKLKAAFNKSLAAAEAADKERKGLQKEGVKWDDPRSKAVSAKMGKAQESITTIRQALYAVDRDRFLRESAEVKRLDLKAQAIRKEVEDSQKKGGLNPWTLPDDHPLKKRLAEATDMDNKRFYEVEPRRKAAFYGEPATVTKAKSDGGGQVDPSVPSRVPRGGASQDLKDFLNGSEVVMAFNPSGFSKFVKEGEAKNGFQQGTGGIKRGKSGYLESRKSGEEKVMGISKQTEASQRPVYAALEHPDRAKSLQGGQHSQMAHYGGIQVVMNPSVKDRATFTIDDSLDFNAPRGIMASPVRDPADPARAGAVESKKVDFNPGGGTSSDRMLVSAPGLDASPNRPSYVETQIHGGLKVSDIKEVRYYKGNDIPASTKKLLEKQGVKIVELPPQMNDLRVYSDDPGYKDITAISPSK